MKVFLPLLVYFLIMSLATFTAYGMDKSRARRSEYRISEKTLLGLGAVGGALGGLIGMKLFHHKTKHWYFWLINFAALAAHIAIAVTLLRS